MSSGYKLYPPIIGDSIPAFYEENGTAVIAVPFSVNRAVDVNDIVGLKIKIKTVQSNVLLETLEIADSISIQSMINNRIARFEWSCTSASFSKISIGQFLKIQIAFLSASGESSAGVITGYFSNVGIAKFTAKPKVYILNGEASNPNGTAIYKMNYVGVYNTQGDVSERPYSYCFTMYDAERNVVESSGWLLHNSSVTYTVSESLSIDSVIDTYSYSVSLLPNEIYYIQYSVRTINNLEVHSPIYSCMDIPAGRPVIKTSLKAENNFEEGYISVKFAMPRYKYLNAISELSTHEDYEYWSTSQSFANNSSSVIPKNYFYSTDYTAKNIQIISTENYDESIIKNTIKNNKFPWMATTSQVSDFYYFLKSFRIVPIDTDSVAKVSRLKSYQQHLDLLIKYLEEYMSDDLARDQILSNPISIAVERADSTENFENWQVIEQKYFTTYTEIIDDWELTDFTIEQGIYYKYSFRQFNAVGVMTGRDKANFDVPIMADFEDMFLYGGGKTQLKIRFNPKVASFKATQLEQKIETLGSRFPFIFKNGVINYKEFPIAGLISYNSDIAQLFVDYKNDLGLEFSKDIQRKSSGVNTPDDEELNNYFDNLINPYSTTNYNMRAERIFKLKVLEWLNDGNIKLFKSPAEGNYLVRLMNVSLTPEDKLGRMLHSFSAQACEVEELTFANLKSLGFVSGNSGLEEQILTVESVNVYDKFIKPLNSKPGRNTSFSINGEDVIIDYLIFEPTENTETINGVDFRIGGNSSANRVLVFTHTGLDLSVNNAVLPNVYFNIYDNIDNMNDNQPAFDGDQGSNIISDDSSWTVLKNALRTLLSDVVVTYGYYSKDNRVGQLGNISNVYIQNKIQTHIGPWSKSISINTDIPIEGTGTLEQILKYVVLDFYEKEVIELTYDSSSRKYYNSSRQSVPKSSWDPLCIYRIMVHSSNKLKTADTTPQPGKQYYQLTMQNDIPYYERVSNLTGVNLSNYYSWESSVDELQASSGGSFSSIRTAGINTVVTMVLADGTTVTTQKPPVVLNLNNQYQSINIGNGVYLQSAYQARIVEYSNS